MKGLLTRIDVCVLCLSDETLLLGREKQDFTQRLLNLRDISALTRAIDPGSPA
jgi:hypothetical protein